MKKTILIVDDEPEVLKTIASLVQNEGHDVVRAESGERALEILAKRNFDLVLTDLVMPGISGWQLLEAAKKEYPFIKVAVLTGYIDQEGEEILTNKNIDGYLVKPVDVRKLQDLLASLLEGEDIIGGHVVAIDDDRVTLTMLDKVLSTNGFLVTTFTEAEKAIAHAHGVPVHLFVVDIEMPGMTGFDVCREIRKSPELREIPIIFLTGHSRSDVVVHALKQGIQGFVVKPYDPDDLIAKVKKAIAGGIGKD